MNKNNKNIKNLIIAHKGIYNNLNIPENSKKAFQRALERKLPIELDIHLTKDNRLVVFHDTNLQRMTGKNKQIRKCSYQELKTLNLLNTKEKIPLLKDILTLVNGKVLIDIEIKDDKRLLTTNKLLTNILDHYNGPFLIQSFYPKYIFWFKKYRPNYTRGLLITNTKKFCYQFIDSKFFLKKLKPDFIAYNKHIIACSKVQKIRKSGISIFAWTIKTKKEKITAQQYADSLISEYLNND